MTDMTDPDPIHLAAARAWCLAKFLYGHEDQAEREQHIAYDAASTADEPWLRAVVDTVREAERERHASELATTVATAVTAYEGPVPCPKCGRLPRCRCIADRRPARIAAAIAAVLTTQRRPT